MADFGIYTKNADIQARAGINANTTAKATAATDVYVLDVEAEVNDLTRTNWSDLVTAGLNADTEGILREASASICAMKVIAADMSGFSSLLEAQSMVDILDSRSKIVIKALREDKEVRRFITNA